MSQRVLAVEPVGGLGEMGIHHLAVDLGGDSFLLDCGAGVPGPEHPGVDRIVPSTEPARRRWRDGRLRGLILTHGHRDHIGAVGDLLAELPELPIYGSEFTLALLRQQLKRSGYSGASPELRTIRHGEAVRIGRASVTWLRVTHSILSAASVAIEAPQGSLVHSGDFRIQQEPLLGEASDEEGLRQLGDRGVDLALVDSTSASSPGRTVEERVLVENLTRRIRQVRGRVVITCFSSHMERLAGCLAVAEATGRKVAVYGRSLTNMVDLVRERGLLPLKKGLLRSVQEVVAGPASEALIVVTGTQGEWMAPLARIARGDDSLLQLGEGDFVGWSARAIPGNERAVGNLVDRFVQAGVDVRPPWGPGEPIHSSGHAHGEEIAEWLSWVRPSFVLPVHGQHWHLESHRGLLDRLGYDEERILQARSGERLELWPETGEHRSEECEASEPRLVAGRFQLAPSARVFKERRKLGQLGSAVVLVPWDGGPAGKPVVVTQGVFPETERARLEAEVVEDISVALEGRSGQAGSLEAARLALRHAVARRSGTKVPCVSRIVSVGDMVENVKV